MPTALYDIRKLPDDAKANECFVPDETELSHIQTALYFAAHFIDGLPPDKLSRSDFDAREHMLHILEQLPGSFASNSLKRMYERDIEEISGRPFDYTQHEGLRSFRVLVIDPNSRRVEERHWPLVEAIAKIVEFFPFGAPTECGSTLSGDAIFIEDPRVGRTPFPGVGLVLRIENDKGFSGARTPVKEIERNIDWDDWARYCYRGLHHSARPKTHAAAPGLDRP